MDPSQLQPGYKLDRYELLTPLAYGGMASVWLARFGGRLGFERLVVVKMILPQYSQDPRFQQMFLDEARIASKIEHSNVARILDVGEHEGNYFIVMEWVDGDSLSKLNRAAEQQNRRVPTGIALRICADAAAGLHAAHTLIDRDGSSLGVVHRDVSPQNLLIANTGATMLIDFGVAKARDRVSQETSAGQLKGKIRYMAPEQARGANIDARADIWALGAILYELFAGAPPYDGANEVATLHKLTSGAAPPPLPHDIPPAVQAIVARALAFDPDERYATALELNLALESAMVEIGESTSMAMVANYTGHLLADRKSARKKAVDQALAKANAAPVPPGSSPRPIMQTPQSFPVVPRQSAAGQTVAMTEAPVRAPSSQPSVRFPTQPDAMHLAESPSATSNATLGSGAMGFSNPPDAVAAQRRRNVGIALAISAVAAMVGVALIVTAVRKREPTATEIANQPPPVTSTLPARSAEPATPPTTATTSTTGSSVSAGEIDPPTTSATPTGAPPTTTPTHRTTIPAVTTKPNTVAAPKPTSTGKKDYGF